MRPYVVYGWRLSYYTAKINCYLNYKQIPNQFKPMNAYDLLRTAPKKTGASVMPIILTPQNEWLQDTRDMIELFEKLFPSPNIFPKRSELLFLSNLLEAWGDEYWIPFAMHYRWRYPENVEFFRKEASDNFLPSFVPQFVKKPLVDGTASRLKGFLPAVGDRPEQFEMMESWTNDILSKLNAHFAVTPYLLGDAATNADFGLAGPLVAHLCRDPYSKRELMKPYPYVASWAERIEQVPHSGKSITEELQVLPTLQPILQSIFSEFIPMIEATTEQIRQFEASPKFTAGKPFPRALREIEFPFLQGKYSYKRRALPFNAWKMQKVLNVYHQSQEEKSQINEFLKKYSLPLNHLETLKNPQLRRSALNVYRPK